MNPDRQLRPDVVTGLYKLTDWVTDRPPPYGQTHYDGCERVHVWCLATSVRLWLVNWDRDEP